MSVPLLLVPIGFLLTGGCTAETPSQGSAVQSGSAVPGGPVFAATGGAGGIAGGASGAAGDWCSIAPVLAQRCGLCHAASPLYGAPMSLVEHSDLHALGSGGVPTYQRIAERVQDPVRPMPPVEQPQLSAAERAALVAYMAAGAPALDPTCATGAAGSPGPSPNGPPGPGGAVDAGAQLDASSPPADSDAYQLLAHGQPGAADTTPYSVGATERYQCFFFKPPWGSDKVQGLRFKPIIDATRVVHHWILYAEDNATGKQDGQVYANDCATDQNKGGRYFVTGWAPGTEESVLPDGVGLQLPSGLNAMFTLEVHYFNPQGPAEQDRSGVEMWVTRNLRANEAAVHWLGTEEISIPAGSGADAVGTCTPNQGQPVTLLGLSPHQHKLGVHTKVELLRSGGAGTTLLHDQGFSFESQLAYPLDAVLMPGDTLRTTCSYTNTTNATVKYGESTTEEMCYLFVTAYPAGALHNGRNGCVAPGFPCYPGGPRRCIDREPSAF